MQCWTTIESWCLFRRNCLANEKVFSEYTQTQPALKLSDIVSKVKSQTNAKPITKKSSSTGESCERVNSPQVQEKTNQAKQVTSSNIVVQSKSSVAQSKDMCVRPVVRDYSRKKRKEPDDNQGAVQSQDVICTDTAIQSIVKNEEMVTSYEDELLEEKMVRTGGKGVVSYNQKLLY